MVLGTLMCLCVMSPMARCGGEPLFMVNPELKIGILCGLCWKESGQMRMNHGWWSLILMRRCGNLNTCHVLEDLKHKWHDLGICYLIVIYMTWGSEAGHGPYDNKLGGDRNVKARIDRWVASPCWMDPFKDATVTHITSSRSDHSALFLCYSVQPSSKRSPRPFCYEHMW